MSDPVVGPDPESVVTLNEAPGPVPLAVGRKAPGNAEIDKLLERLSDANVLPTQSHIEVYEEVHRGLRDALTALDTRPVSSPPHPLYKDRS